MTEKCERCQSAGCPMLKLGPPLPYNHVLRLRAMIDCSERQRRNERERACGILSDLIDETANSDEHAAIYGWLITAIERIRR